MPVKQYLLDGNAILSLAGFYDEVSRRLPLPPHFGRNLDALADVLSTDIAGPFEIVWKHASASKKALKNDFVRIEGMLKHVAAERADFRITFHD
ncbi:MAG: barstar family protein [Nitrospiraceae bacterium]|jgi:ribonuclease inhibitor|nr:barstar family protein [Nitrospiraceae bacterium]